MIFTSLHRLFKEKYFENKIDYFDFFKLTRHYFPEINPKMGFVKKEYYTVVSDLNCDDNEIFSKLKKSTRYKINRGKREGIVFQVEEDVDKFFEYYNDFALSKNLEELNYSTLIKYKEHMVITKAVHENKILVMHVHIYNANIAMLLFSASHFRNTLDSKEKNIIGYANLLLHYEEMLFFKGKGCEVYDFGGYAYETDDKSLIGINNFKDLFNPILTKRFIYTSWLLQSIVVLKSVFSKIGLKMRKL